MKISIGPHPRQDLWDRGYQVGIWFRIFGVPVLRYYGPYELFKVIFIRDLIKVKESGPHSYWKCRFMAWLWNLGERENGAVVVDYKESVSKLRLSDFR
ncbi:MAG: hypothetical protein KY445_04920 [Armatimonadetes bacterium]|nr:hypothetical protein [Armatimonadota bacterium]